MQRPKKSQSICSRISLIKKRQIKTFAFNVFRFVSRFISSLFRPSLSIFRRTIFLLILLTYFPRRFIDMVFYLFSLLYFSLFSHIFLPYSVFLFSDIKISLSDTFFLTNLTNSTRRSCPRLYRQIETTIYIFDRS